MRRREAHENIEDRLTLSGMSNTDQVQVAWIKTSLEELAVGVFPPHADVLKGHLITGLQTLHTIIQIAKSPTFATDARLRFHIDNKGSLIRSPDHLLLNEGDCSRSTVQKPNCDHNN